MRYTLGIIVGLAAGAFAAPAPAAKAPRLPYSFEENCGQAAPEVRYLARGQRHTLFLTNSEAVVALRQADGAHRLVHMAPQGGRAAQPEPLQPRPETTNYFLGNDPAQWSRSTPHYNRVRYRGVYPGIDLVFHNQQDQLEYDFIVEPGADPRAVALRFTGADRLSLNRDGSLEIHAGPERLRHRAPVVYQDIAGARRTIPASYEMRPDGSVGFRLAAYDASQPLVIDPVLVYSTYIGGDRGELISAVAVDKDGNVFVTGEMTSNNFPIVGVNHVPLQGALVYSFVTKLNPAGNAILFSTIIGGNSNTRGRGIAVDSASNVYTCGVTGARNFPLANPVQNTQPGLNIAYITKLSADGKQLLFSTYLGGERNDEADAIAVDTANNIYITGRASSQQFPVTNAIQPQLAGNFDLIAAKFAAPNYRLVYSTYFGGPNNEEGYGIAVDPTGSAYLTGYAQSPGLATPGAYQTLSKGWDAFILKLTPTGGKDRFTYFGGTGTERARAIALGLEGNIWIAGSSDSANMPVTTAGVQQVRSGNTDAFLAAFDPWGGQLLYATYFGGSNTKSPSYTEEIQSLVIDREGSIHIAGVTSSQDFPTVRHLQSFGGGAQDGFVAKFTPGGEQIVYSTPLGGDKDDMAYSLAVDQNIGVYIGGQTASPAYPLKNALRSTLQGADEAFLTKLCDPKLFASPSQLSFIHIPGNAAPAAQRTVISACTAIPFNVTVNGAWLRASATSGMTDRALDLTVDPAGLVPGDYQGSLTVTAPEATNSPLTIPVVLRVAPPPPAFTVQGIVNAATNKGGAVSPGEIVVIYGANLGPDQLYTAIADGDGGITTEIMGTRVIFDGIPAPMVYTYKGQVSAVVPYGIPAMGNTRVQVEYLGQRSGVVMIAIHPTQPGLFTANSTGTGPVAAINQDGSLNSVTPADPGSVVAFYATGEGQTNPGGKDGRLAVSLPLPKPLQEVTVTIDGQPCEVLYAGAAPGLVAGLMQVNVKIPSSVPTGNRPVVLTIGGTSSPAGVTVSVK